MSARAIRVELYDDGASTRLAVLEQAADVAWLDVLSRQGQCSFSLPTDDAKLSLLTDYRFVKMSWNGLTFGHRLSPEQTWRHTDNRGRIVFSGPGMGSLLTDWVLYPEYALGRYSEDVRGFGPYSKSGNWLTGDTGWVAPETLDYSSDSGRREGRPKALKKLAPHADWISVNGAYVDEPNGAIFWTRQGTTLDAGTDVMVVWTGDNFVDQWLDGRLIGAADDDVRGWRKLKRWRGRLSAGSHVLAARVENAEHVSGNNPMAYICVVVSLTANGDPDEVLLKTGPGWDVHEGDPEPGWFAGNILHRAHSEAIDRDVKGALTLPLGFTTDDDSDGDPWTGDRITFERPVGTPGDEFAAALTEFGLDWHVDWPDGGTPELNAHNRRGVSRTTGATPVRLFLPQGLADYGTKREHARRTALLARRANGRWKERTLGVGSAGRMETYGSVTAAGSEGTVNQLVDALLRSTSSAQVSALVSGSALVGPQPGTAYDPLGDTILVPGHAGVGHIKARSLGVAVQQDGDKVRAWPIFTVDGSE